MWSQPSPWPDHTSGLTVSTLCDQHTWELDLVVTLERPASYRWGKEVTDPLPLGAPCLYSPSSWPWVSLSPAPTHAQVRHILTTHPRAVWSPLLPILPRVPVFPNTDTAQRCSASGALCPSSPIRQSELCSHCRLLGHSRPRAVPEHARLLLPQGPRLHHGMKPTGGQRLWASLA